MLVVDAYLWFPNDVRKQNHFFRFLLVPRYVLFDTLYRKCHHVFELFIRLAHHVVSKDRSKGWVKRRTNCHYWATLVFGTIKPNQHYILWLGLTLRNPKSVAPFGNDLEKYLGKDRLSTFSTYLSGGDHLSHHFWLQSILFQFLVRLFFIVSQNDETYIDTILCAFIYHLLDCLLIHYISTHFAVLRVLVVFTTKANLIVLGCLLKEVNHLAQVRLCLRNYSTLYSLFCLIERLFEKLEIAWVSLDFHVLSKLKGRHWNYVWTDLRSFAVESQA